MRVLEIYNATGKTKTEQEIESRKNDVKYDYSNVFKRNHEEKIEQTSKVEENSLIVYKEGFFTKLVNKIKKIFRA